MCRLIKDRDVQLILREVDQKELALALRGATEEVRNKLLANLSSRGAEIVRDLGIKSHEYRVQRFGVERVGLMAKHLESRKPRIRRVPRWFR